MNYKYIISLVAAFLISYPIFSSAHSTTSPAIPAKQVKSEGQILDALIVLNKNEIAAAHLADKKSSNPEVKQFADFMIKEHGANLQKTKQLSEKLDVKAIEGKTAIELQNKGKQELVALKKLKGSSFDKAYIDAMVKGHREALSLIGTWISKSSNPLIKEHLKSTKAHVKLHLEKVQALQQSLG